MSQMYRQIVVTGISGVGKSTIGRGLAYRLGWGFIDLDQWICKQDGVSLSDVFDSSSMDGIKRFRQRETQALKQVLGAVNHVIALGGGTLISESNQQQIYTKSDLCVLWLVASPQQLARRIVALHDRQQFLQSRPLFADLVDCDEEKLLENLSQRIEEQLSSRLLGYKQSHIQLSTLHCSMDISIYLAHTVIQEFFAQ